MKHFGFTNEANHGKTTTTTRNTAFSSGMADDALRLGPYMSVSR
jgi:hypothetical protein